jgi:hypothetical protein
MAAHTIATTGTAQRHATDPTPGRAGLASATRVRRSEAASASSVTAVSEGSAVSIAASRSARGCSLKVTI